jgi:hypothetical protein
MANFTYVAPNTKNTQHTGVYGNCVILDGELPIGGAMGITSNTGDTVTVDLIKIPAGSEIHEIKFVNGTYNVGSTIDVGIRYIDLDKNHTIPTGSAPELGNLFLTAQDVSAASNGFKVIKPKKILSPAMLTVTFKGATGEQIKKAGADLWIGLIGKSGQNL